MQPPLDQPELNAGEERSLRLPAHGNTVAAEELRVRLVLASDFDGEMIVDASAVENIGQAVLQILVAARIEAERCGQIFSIVDPSAAFTDRVTQCRLAEAIGLAPVSGDSM